MAGYRIYRILFIITILWADTLSEYAFFEMQTYLTDVWGLSFTHAAAVLNVWHGIRLILPGFFLFVSHTWLGQLLMLKSGIISYATGVALIAMSTPPALASITGMCDEYEPRCIGLTHRVLFYTGAVIYALGQSSTDYSFSHFLLKEEAASQDRNQAMIAVIRIAPIAGAIALPYITPWSIRFAIPAVISAFAIIFLFIGCRDYGDITSPQGSPITNVFRVFVACVSYKMRRPFNRDTDLHMKDDEELTVTRTRFLRGLEKAAIYSPPKDDLRKKWKFCTLADVEEAKIVIRMIPMWMTFIICGIVTCNRNTFFVEQSSHMSRKLVTWNVPLQVLLLLNKVISEIFKGDAIALTKNESKKRSEGRTTGNDGKTSTKNSKTGTDEGKTATVEGKTATDEVHKVVISTQKELIVGTKPAYGIGIAMILSVLCCITAARIEKKRLHVIKQNDLLDRPDDDIPMSMFWLLFQFLLIAGIGPYLQRSVAGFYAHQAPKSMVLYLQTFTRAMKGVGNILSVLVVYVVGQVSEKWGKANWFQNTLNRSHLDKYYWVLAVLTAVNFVIFVLVASQYRYTDLEAADDDYHSDVDAGNNGGNRHELTATTSSQKLPWLQKQLKTLMSIKQIIRDEAMI